MMFQDQTDLWHRLQENATRKTRLRNTMLNNQEDYPGSGYTYETAQDLTRPGSVRRRPLLRHSTSHAGEVPAVANGVPMVPVRSRAFTEPTGVVVEPSAPPRHLENIPDEDEEQPDPGNNSNVKSGTGETRLWEMLNPLEANLNSLHFANISKCAPWNEYIYTWECCGELWIAITSGNRQCLFKCQFGLLQSVEAATALEGYK